MKINTKKRIFICFFEGIGFIINEREHYFFIDFRNADCSNRITVMTSLLMQFLSFFTFNRPTTKLTNKLLILINHHNHVDRVSCVYYPRCELRGLWWQSLYTCTQSPTISYICEPANIDALRLVRSRWLMYYTKTKVGGMVYCCPQRDW